MKRKLPDPPSGVPEGFWDDVAAAKDRLLMLDYDGTLVPFRVDRSEARLAPGVRETIRAISHDTRVVVVSGRPIAELSEMFEGLDLDFVGEHGWEERRRGQATHPFALPDGAAEGLEEAWNAAAVVLGAARLQRKRSSVVLHTRGLDPEDARRIEADVTALWRGWSAAGLDPRPVNGGVELRTQGRDKGTAVSRLIAESPPGTRVVYLGDDLTDEDAFAAIEGRGIGIRVGPSHPTQAIAALSGPDQVASFLERWRAVTAGASHR